MTFMQSKIMVVCWSLEFFKVSLIFVEHSFYVSAQLSLQPYFHIVGKS